MKKMISLLAVALFATTFAAGCGKNTECKQATKKEDCVADKFEKDKFTCEWVPKAGGKAEEGTCADKKVDPNVALCAAAKTEDTCKAATANLKDAGTKACAFTAPDKCELK